jgi:hypothetical protein
MNFREPRQNIFDRNLDESRPAIPAKSSAILIFHPAFKTLFHGCSHLAIAHMARAMP